VVIFDSAVEGQGGTDFISFVATDNRKGGEMAARELLRLMGDKKNVFLLKYAPGHASTGDREQGFLSVMKGANVKMLLDENQYAGATEDEAKTKAIQLKHHLQNADGIFCPNESSTLGMLGALDDQKMLENRKVKFVGFDATPRLVKALREGKIDALIAQDPERMGYEAVKALVRHLNGEKVDPVIDTGVTLITRDNLDKPEIKKLIGE
jgi:ribose transport system substrate-binding protein